MHAFGNTHGIDAELVTQQIATTSLELGTHVDSCCSHILAVPVHLPLLDACRPTFFSRPGREGWIPLLY